MSLDLTKGNPTKLLIQFMLPMLFSSVFQQFYNIADTFVVGRYIGPSALAAVGTTGNITSMVLILLQGATSGISVVVAQIFGSGNHSRLRQSVALSAMLVAVLTLSLGAIGATLTPPLLKLINVPADVLPDATAYMRIVLLGSLASGFYNLASSLLRSMGDSVTPLVLLIVSSMLNLGLNILFVTAFHLGVPGVAYATVLASAISAVACIVYGWRKRPVLRFGRSDMKWDWSMVKTIMKIGLPASLMSATINIGMIMIQTLVNGYGTVVMAGYALGLKMEHIFNGLGFTAANAMSVFSAQNVGAGDYDRVHKGFKSSLTISMSIIAVLSPIMVIFGRSILNWFTNDGADVVTVAYRYTLMIALSVPFVLVLITTRNTMHGAGDAMIPFIMGVFELVSRFLCAYFLSIAWGYVGVFLGTPLAWISGAIFGAIRYRSGKWKNKRIQVEAETAETAEAE